MTHPTGFFRTAMAAGLLCFVASLVRAEEEPAYRNVALNPADVQGKAESYPHASANSEYKNLPPFAARCAIDGKTANHGHGAGCPSWGPDRRTDLWWRVDLGRTVAIDKVVIVIRADFPHDRHWHSATIEFSDGSREEIEIEKTDKPQTFSFTSRKATWLRLTDLVQEEPLGWCGLSEVEVWGR
ncbi:MAG: discoidin domain-containing protein [Planctomycetes bacterium]|nr:discoidin domain-containing protein [Planctomycetota bacterium]